MEILVPMLGLFLVFLNFKALLRKPEGTEVMRDISLRIRKDDDTFINHEYRVVFIYATIIAVALGVLTAWYVSVAFLIGATMSSLAGYIGMKAATRANVRVAEAARLRKPQDRLNKSVFL